MIPPRDAPKIRDYFQILSRLWVVVLCATVLSAGMGWFAWRHETPIYASTSRVLISSRGIGAATPLDALYGQINADSRIITYQYLARSARVTGPVIDRLGLSQSTDELAGRISIPPSLTPVLDIVVKGTDPDETHRVADAVTASVVAVSAQLAKIDGSSTELVQIDAAGPAMRQGTPKQSIIKATALGFVVSLVLVLAWGLVEDRLLGRGQLERAVESAGRPE